MPKKEGLTSFNEDSSNIKNPYYLISIGIQDDFLDSRVRIKKATYVSDNIPHNKLIPLLDKKEVFIGFHDSAIDLFVGFDDYEDKHSNLKTTYYIIYALLIAILPISLWYSFSPNSYFIPFLVGLAVFFVGRVVNKKILVSGIVKNAVSNSVFYDSLPGWFIYKIEDEDSLKSELILAANENKIADN